MLPVLDRLALYALPSERRIVVYAGSGLGFSGATDPWVAPANGDPTSATSERAAARAQWSAGYASFLTHAEAKPADQVEQPTRAQLGLAQLVKHGIAQAIVTIEPDPRLLAAIRDVGWTPLVLRGEAESRRASRPLQRSVPVYCLRGSGPTGQHHAPSWTPDLLADLQDRALLAVGCARHEVQLWEFLATHRCTPQPNFWVHTRPPPDFLAARLGSAPLHVDYPSGVAFFFDLIHAYFRVGDVTPAALPLTPAARQTYLALDTQSTDQAVDAMGHLFRAFQTLVSSHCAQQEPFRQRKPWQSVLGQTQPAVAQILRVTRYAIDQGAGPVVLAIVDALATPVATNRMASGLFVTEPACDERLLRFLHRELFVMVCSMLLRTGSLDLLAMVLRALHGELAEHPRGPALLDRIARPLAAEEERPSYAQAAELLKARHSEGSMGNMVPWPDYVAADVFLSLALWDPASARLGWRLTAPLTPEILHSGIWWLEACRSAEFATALHACCLGGRFCSLDVLLSSHMDALRQSGEAMWLLTSTESGLRAQVAAVGSQT